MPVNELNNDVYTGEARSSSGGVIDKEIDQKTKRVAKEKITPVPQEKPPPATYSILDSIYQLFGGTPAPSTSPIPPETPPKTSPSCDSLWSQRDLPRLFDLLEVEMTTPQGITWKPSVDRNRLPQLKGPSTYLNKNEPSEEEIVEMLTAFIPTIESRHGVQISTAAFEECLALSQRFIKNERFPDKALDLLEQAASFASLSETSQASVMLQDQKLAVFLDRLLLMRQEVDDPQIIDQKTQEIRSRLTRTVTIEHMREMVSRKTGISIKKLQKREKNFVASLEKQISDVWKN